MNQRRIPRVLAGVALLALLFLVTTATTGLHRHQNGSREACQICRVGQMPALQNMVGATTSAPVFLAWQAPAKASHPALNPAPAPGSSRAPPSA